MITQCLNKTKKEGNNDLENMRKCNASKSFGKVNFNLLLVRQTYLIFKFIMAPNIEKNMEINKPRIDITKINYCVVLV
jgi:hypothetical protein